MEGWSRGNLTVSHELQRFRDLLDNHVLLNIPELLAYTIITGPNVLESSASCISVRRPARAPPNEAKGEVKSTRHPEADTNEAHVTNRVEVASILPM